MTYLKKIALITSILGIFLVIVYFLMCNIWFIGAVKKAVIKVPLLRYEKMTVRGFNKLGLQNVSLDAGMPAEIRFDQMNIASDRRILTRDSEYQITLDVLGGEVVLGTDDEDIEGYRGDRFEIMPFRVLLQMREKGGTISGADIVVKGGGTISYDFDLTRNYLAALIKIVIDKELIDNALEPHFFKQALNTENDQREFTLDINGELPLVRVRMKSPLIEMDFAYSSENR